MITPREAFVLIVLYYLFVIQNSLKASLYLCNDTLQILLTIDSRITYCFQGFFFYRYQYPGHSSFLVSYNEILPNHLPLSPMRLHQVYTADCHFALLIYQ